VQELAGIVPEFAGISPTFDIILLVIVGKILKLGDMVPVSSGTLTSFFAEG
jgi:hypothetical protein